MAKILNIALVLSALSLLGCASALKKQCEKTNWFEHGHGVAMSGKRLNSDDLAQRCEKEGVPVSYAELDLGFKAGMTNYCKPDVALQTGKNGQPLNLEMCATSDHSALRMKHREGVLVFCQPTNGFPFGSTGAAYQGVCPKNVEAAFLKEFRRGRKVYLTQQIAGKESEIQHLDSEVNDLNAKRAELRSQMNALSNSKILTREKQFGATGVRETVQFKDDEESKQQKQNIEWEISRVDREIREKRQEQQSLRSEIVKMKTEAAGLE